MIFDNKFVGALFFACFYFRDFMLIREIRENKNLAKISTYTVYDNFEAKCW